MKTVRLLGDRRVEVVEAPEPEPDHDYVVVKVLASAICGTERHGYEEGLASPAIGLGIMNGGHEATGIVWKARAGGPLKEGDRVNLFSTRSHCGRCRYCAQGRWVLCHGEPARPGAGYHSEYVLKRHDFCLPLADDISFDLGALFGDVLGTAYRAIRRLGVGEMDSVLVMGQGPIGLAATMICSFLGARVVAGDPSPPRRRLATTCGADAVFDPEREDAAAFVRRVTGSDGVDVAIDCAGFQQSRVACLQAARRGGRVALVGLHDGLELDRAAFSQNFFLKDLDLVASWYSNPDDSLDLADLVRRGLDPGRMVTHTFPIDEAPEAFDTMFSLRGARF